MTDLLSASEYHRIAHDLKLPSSAIIDGKPCGALSGETFTSTNPATGERLAVLPACSRADVDVAVASARTAFNDGRWSKLHPAERKHAILRLADLIEKNALELAVMESLDAGKTILDCQTVDVPETINVLRWHAEAIDKI